MNHSCLWFDLKKACIIIGITDMVIYTLLFAANYVQLVEHKWRQSETGIVDDFETCNEDLSFPEHVIGAIDSTVGIIVCIGLIFGAANEKPGLILPWLMGAILSVIYYFISKVLFVGASFALYNAVFLMRIIIAACFFVVVYVFFKKLLSERQRSSSINSSL